MFLIHFFKKQKLLDFCCQELEALSELLGADLSTLYHQDNPRESINIDKKPYVYVNFPSLKVAQEIQKRSILIKQIIDVFS